MSGRRENDYGRDFLIGVAAAMTGVALIVLARGLFTEASAVMIFRNLIMGMAICAGVAALMIAALFCLLRPFARWMDS